MFKFLSSLLIYILGFGLLGFWTYLSITSQIYKKSKWVIVGGVIVWASFIFNIAYTGILGWNFVPASDLESFLDSLTSVIGVIGWVMFAFGVNKAK